MYILAKYANMGINSVIDYSRTTQMITCKIPLKLPQKSNGLTPLTYIVQENTASIALFTGLGFEVSHEASWLLNFQTATSKVISP